MAVSDAIGRAREAYQRKDWREAHAAFAAASRDGLEFTDVEMYATAAHLFGREAESREILAQGYRDALGRQDAPFAARFAFWMGHGLMFSGNDSQSGAWFARCRAVLDEYSGECVERSYLLMSEGLRQLFSGEPSEAEGTFATVQADARRFGDRTLFAMGGHGRGRALVALGRIAEGMASLDEVMLAATAGEISPIIVGDAYCGILDACHDVFDVHRAREWTAALTRWCESQPDLVPYRGPCLVHRVELMRLNGEWQDAFEEAQRACEWLSMHVSPEGAGDAYYELGQLHRLRGELEAAEEAYRQASRCGRRPQPGLALVGKARGQVEPARAAVHAALEEPGTDSFQRVELLGAYIEILLALGEKAAARAAATELAGLASRFEALMPAALADRAMGRVLVAEGEARAALEPLRRAWMAWQRLDAPFEAARERVQIGCAYRALGNGDSAEMEFDAARWVFQELGALPELVGLDEIAPPIAVAAATGGLTSREVQVLQLVARGLSNKEIASTLVISEHTVARHVQNMLSKLDFSSRSRLAAFAVERGIAIRPNGQE